MQYPHDALSREESVSDHADKKWRDHCCNCKGRIGLSNTLINSRFFEMFSHICAHRNIPCPPNKILEKHHDREKHSCLNFHAAILFIINGRLLMKALAYYAYIDITRQKRLLIL